jgi:hypothetical protein
MKILLVGEYSGVHTDLAIALRENGHQVIAAHHGDDFKNYPRDFDLRPMGSNYLLRRIDMARKYGRLLKLISTENFDVIQLINPGIFPKGWGKLIYKKIFSSGAKVFFLGAGEDNVVWDAYRAGAYRYYAFQGMEKNDMAPKKNPWNSPYLINLSNEVLQKANAIIPLCVEYLIAYKRSFSKTPFVPISINPGIVSAPITEKKYDKIRILHGVNKGREGYKGSNFIVPAMEKIREKYGDRVEVIFSENMPFSEYLKLLWEVNVVVDQALCYSVSMTALYSMLSGCVVVGGCEPEYLDSLCIREAPLVNIIPDTDDIYRKLEYLVLNPEKVKEYGQWARSFVLEHHSIQKNVHRFLKIWETY